MINLKETLLISTTIFFIACSSNSTESNQIDEPSHENNTSTENNISVEDNTSTENNISVEDNTSTENNISVEQPPLVPPSPPQ